MDVVYGRRLTIGMMSNRSQRRTCRRHRSAGIRRRTSRLRSARRTDRTTHEQPNPKQSPDEIVRLSRRSGSREHQNDRCPRAQIRHAMRWIAAYRVMASPTRLRPSPRTSHVKAARRRAERLRDGTPERIRTSDTQLRRLVLYPAELRAHISVPKSTTASARVTRPATPAPPACVRGAQRSPPVSGLPCARRTLWTSLSPRPDRLRTTSASRGTRLFSSSR